MMGQTKRILLAVDAGKTSVKAAAYVADMVGALDEVEVCLLFVGPEPPPFYYLEGNSFKDYVKENETLAAPVFDRIKGILSDTGINPARISTKVYITSKGETISDGILAVQKEKSSGTVVVGKRGVTKSEEFLFGSISSAMAHGCSGFAVWIVS